MSDYAKKALDAHRKHGGKLEIASKLPVTTREELAIAYTPGVAAVCQAIVDDVGQARTLTGKGNAVAVVSDGSAVLGLGNIGPEAALPVMEGKAVLFKEFADVDAYPIVLDTQDTEGIIAAVKAIAPGFAGINLEDIAAPRCFEIEERLKTELDIPVFHDDQHGTAIVVLAGLMNALTVVSKEKRDIRVVINGAGAGGIATAKLLSAWGVGSFSVLDSKGVISSKRKDLHTSKEELLQVPGYTPVGEELADALVGCDVFIGLSQPNVLTDAHITSMGNAPIIFALANPEPEILPEAARASGAAVVATGRSDFPNQVNNVLAFPGIFRGLLDRAARDVTDDIKIAAAEGIAQVVKEPRADHILPDVFDANVARVVSGAIR